MKQLIFTALVGLAMVGFTGCTTGSDAQANTKAKCSASGKCASGGKCSSGKCKSKKMSKKCAAGKCGK